MTLSLPRKCPALKDNPDESFKHCFFFDLDDDLEMASYGKGTKFGCIHCKFLPFEQVEQEKKNLQKEKP